MRANHPPCLVPFGSSRGTVTSRLSILPIEMLHKASSRRSEVPVVPRRFWLLVACIILVATARSQITSKKQFNTNVYFGSGISKVSPAYGPGDTSVMITGGDLSNITAVTFGGAQAGFKVLSNTAVQATAPLKGVPGSTVPVSAISNGQVVPTAAFYSYPISEMDVTGPMPFARGTVGDMTWYNGGGHQISVNPPKTLSFTTATPVIHIQVAFQDDSNSYTSGSYQGDLVGDGAAFSANLQMCSLNGVPSFAIADTHQPCTNYDNNSGTWVILPTQSATLHTAGPGQASFGDIALHIGSAFDNADTVRTFRLSLSLQQSDSHTAEAQSYRMASSTSSPFNVVISPAALIQLSVLPHTILYQPPGNQSTVSFSASANYGTNYSLGNSTDTSNSSSDTEKTSDNFNFTLAFFLGVTNTQKGSYDTTTKEGFGTTNTSTNGGSSGMTFSGAWNAPAIASLVPGSGATCASATDCSTVKNDPNIRAKEPFWYDRFILLVHPQFATWVVGGDKDRYVMYGAVPVTANADIAQLDACAGGVTLYGQDQCTLDYTDDGLQAGGQSQIFYSGSYHSIELTKNDATQLLLLDPFYVGGQGAQLSAQRAIPVASVNYGAKIGQPPTTYTGTLNNVVQTQQGTNNQQSNTSQVTDVIGYDNSIGMTASVSNSGASYKAGVTLDNSDQISEDNTVKTTFTDSTATSNQNVTQASVTLNDVDDTTQGTNGPGCKACHDPLPAVPSVNIYMDRMFGSFMFQDPAAPHTSSSNPLTHAPAPLTCSSVLLATSTSDEQKTQRFSDVPLNASSHTAIGLLARTHLLTGENGQFHPNDPLSRVQFATVLANTLRLPSGTSRNFSDVARTDARLGAAQAAINAGLMSSSSPTNFGPAEPVSRQDFAFAVARGFNITGGTATAAADSNQIAPQAASGVGAMVSRGFMKLNSSNSFQPAAPISRAETAQILVDVLNEREMQKNASIANCPAASNPLDSESATPPPAPSAPQPAPANSTILVPDNAYPGGLLTGVVLGPDDQPVPNTPVNIAGAVPADLGGEVVGDPVPCSSTDPACQPQPPAQTGSNPAPPIAPRTPVYNPTETTTTAGSTPAGTPTTPAGGVPTGTTGATPSSGPGIPVNCASLLAKAGTPAGAVPTPASTPSSTPAGSAFVGPTPQHPAASTPIPQPRTPGTIQAITDAAGRFVLCMAPSAPSLSVSLPGGSSVAVPATAGQPSAPTAPPDFYQPGQNITVTGRITDPTATQNGHLWNLPIARAWSPDGSQTITVVRAPKTLDPGPVQISYNGPDGQRHSSQGTAFKIIRAFLDRAQLHSNQGAKFEYVVQFQAGGSGQQLCVQMHVAGPIVMTQAPPEVIPFDANGLGTFAGRIRALPVAPGSTVPFDLGPTIHVCGSK